MERNALDGALAHDAFVVLTLEARVLVLKRVHGCRGDDNTSRPETAKWNVRLRHAWPWAVTIVAIGCGWVAGLAEMEGGVGRWHLGIVIGLIASVPGSGKVCAVLRVDTLLVVYSVIAVSAWMARLVAV